MSMYANAGKENTPPSTGLNMGSALYDAELGQRQKYALPVAADRPEEMASRTRAQQGVPDHYNFDGGLPVKYTVPTPQKERLQTRQAVREAAALSVNPGSNVVRTDPISPEEIDYVQSMMDQAELADFDRFVNTLIDPRKPGNLKWLMEIYPDYVTRRIQQVHTDYEYALRNQMIDSWGINTFDDLHFKYLVDQGKLVGPALTQIYEAGASYAPGALSPFAWFSGGDLRARNGLRLPFASAKFGKRPGNIQDWTLSDNGQPMSKGRGLKEMAKGLYNRPAMAAAVPAGTDME